MNLPATSLIILIILRILSTASSSTRPKRAPGPIVVPLTDKEKMEIIRHHNDLRRLSGSSNMRFMSWDSELEWVAQEYSKKCRFAHNEARKHSRGWRVGENIYVTSAKMLGFETVRAVQSWYDEVTDFSYNTRTCTPGKMCGHYTQIVWATTYKVGCALTSCDYLIGVKWNSGGSIFICNYATAGNIVSGTERKLTSIFEKGPPCSRCDKDDYCRNYLCANSARDFVLQTEESEDEIEGGGSSVGLIVAVIVLSILAVLLAAFIAYRERMRSTVKLGLFGTGAHRSNKFSNQNTPVTSTFNTPRHSTAGTNLHGVQRLTAADIGTPLEKLKVSERFQSASAPTTPRHGYMKGNATPPRVPPPLPPPLLQKT